MKSFSRLFIIFFLTEAWSGVLKFSRSVGYFCLFLSAAVKSPQRVRSTQKSFVFVHSFRLLSFLQKTMRDQKGKKNLANTKTKDRVEAFEIAWNGCSGTRHGRAEKRNEVVCEEGEKGENTNRNDATQRIRRR